MKSQYFTTLLVWFPSLPTADRIQGALGHKLSSSSQLTKLLSEFLSSKPQFRWKDSFESQGPPELQVCLLKMNAAAAQGTLIPKASKSTLQGEKTSGMHHVSH